MTARRSLLLAVLFCAVAGLLILLAAGRRWAHTTVVFGAAQRFSLTVSGHQVAPSLPALGVALLALSAAIIAGRGMLRRAVGVAVVFVGALAVGVAITARGDVSRALQNRERGVQGIAVHASANGWWVLAAVGGVVAVVVGAATALRGPAWSALGARYDAPAVATAPVVVTDSDATAWAALDRGEDPTA